MSTPVSVSAFESKSHDKPDETRTPPKTRLDIVRVGGYTIGRMTASPGWRWSESVKPIVGTESCQLSHVGHVISGQLKVRLDDGTEQTINAGESYSIPPGHDAWVEGVEPCVAIEVLSAEQFGRPAS
jgi:hypothetical protein